MKLTKSDTAFLKGIAILMIVLHNFCHHLPLSVTENEYTFSPLRFQQLCRYIIDGGPHVVLNTISHFGHYGVPLFLFLSGYGLVCKYEKAPHPNLTLWQHAVADVRFVLSHMVKLWYLMIPAIAIYWAYINWSGREWDVSGSDLFAMLTFTSNLFIKRNLILGPWWFFSLILQLYIIYRLVFYHFRSHGLLMAVTLGFFVLQCFLYFADVRLTPDGRLAIFDTDPYHTDLFNYGRYNALAWLLPFSAGVLTARSRRVERCHISRVALLTGSFAGTILLVLSAMNAFQWLLSPLYLLLATLPLAFVVQSPLWRKPLEWAGGISASIFALHPIARAITIPAAKAAERAGEWWATYAHIALYLAISIIAAFLLQYVINRRPH